MNVLRSSPSHLEYNIITLHDARTFLSYPGFFELDVGSITHRNLNMKRPLAIKIIKSNEEAYLLRNVSSIAVHEINEPDIITFPLFDEAPSIRTLLPPKRFKVYAYFEHGIEQHELYKRQ